MAKNMKYPKEGYQKLAETVKDLKSKNRQLRKRVKFLESELENIMKLPKNKERIKKPREELSEELKLKYEDISQEESIENWKKDFLKRYKKVKKPNDGEHYEY